MTIGIWTLIIASAVLVFWVVGAYNRLVRLKNDIAAAFAVLDEQLRRRHDGIARLTERLQAPLSTERGAMDALEGAATQARSAAEQARARPWLAGPLGAMAGAEHMLAGSLQRVLALVEHHETLREDAAVSELTQTLNETRDRIGFARLAYNDKVEQFNQAIAQFPTVLLARVLGFFPCEPLVSLP